jgi:hypothetical protein
MFCLYFSKAGIRFHGLGGKSPPLPGLIAQAGKKYGSQWRIGMQMYGERLLQITT